MTIGTPGKPQPYLSGKPFNRCTHTALAPNGDIYVVGRLRQCLRPQIFAGRQAHHIMGQAGHRAGEFNVPHNIVCDAEGYVYVADRESHRAGVRR